MEKSDAAKLAKILNILVLIAFVCNLVALPLVPGLVGIASEGGLRYFADFVSQDNASAGAPTAVTLFFMVCWQFLWRIWRTPHTAAIAAFLMFCGVCTAIILWQAKRVLDTVLQGNPFQRANAGNLGRAAVCCWIISGVALVRLILWLWAEQTLAPLFTYTALSVPAFFMGGLLFQVMSALFRQAAELKEDQDLTI